MTEVKGAASEKFYCFEKCPIAFALNVINHQRRSMHRGSHPDAITTLTQNDTNVWYDTQYELHMKYIKPNPSIKGRGQYGKSKWHIHILFKKDILHLFRGWHLGHHVLVYPQTPIGQENDSSEPKCLRWQSPTGHYFSPVHWLPKI